MTRGISMSLNVRVFHSEDLPVLVRLLNGEFSGSYEFIPYDVEVFRREIVERNFRVLVAEKDGEVLGCVVYNRNPRGEEIHWLAALSGNFRKAVEEALVDAVERNAESGEVFTSVDADSPKIGFWSSRGYKIEGGLYHMLVKLDSVKPLPKVPEGVTLRSLMCGEDKKLVETVNSGYGFERLREDHISKWKSEHPPFDESWVHVAEADGKIVSAVVSRPDTEYNVFFKAKRGYLGPAVTLPEYRGKNLASALTCRAMNFLYEKGMDSVSLYTLEQNTPSVTLLTKLGFKVAHHWKFLHKKLS